MILREMGSSLREIGKDLGAFLLEPITFTKLLRERMGKAFKPQHSLAIVFPLFIGIAAGLTYGPEAGAIGVAASWILMAQTCRSIRSNEQHSS